MVCSSLATIVRFWGQHPWLDGMNRKRRSLYKWIIFFVLLLVFIAGVWMLFHSEPAATPDFLHGHNYSRPPFAGPNASEDEINCSS